MLLFGVYYTAISLFEHNINVVPLLLLLLLSCTTRVHLSTASAAQKILENVSAFISMCTAHSIVEHQNIGKKSRNVWRVQRKKGEQLKQVLCG